MATDARIRELGKIALKEYYTGRIPDDGKEWRAMCALQAALDEPHDPDPAQEKLEALEGKVRAAVADWEERNHGRKNNCATVGCWCHGEPTRALIAAVDPLKPPEPKFKVGQWVIPAGYDGAYKIMGFERGTYFLKGHKSSYMESELRPLTDEEIGVRA